MSFIGTDEHVFIAGMTGSGKSVTAEHYLAGYANVIKLDTKDEVSERRKQKKPLWKGLVEGKDYTVINRLAELDNVDTPKIIYVPEFDEQTQDHYNSLFKWVYERQNTILWIDELMSIADSPSRYPPYLKALYTRGRSRESVVWALTQRPMDIPTIVMANSTHFFIYNLNMPQDREKVAKATGYPEFYDLPGKYTFWYLNITAAVPPVRGQLEL